MTVRNSSGKQAEPAQSKEESKMDSKKPQVDEKAVTSVDQESPAENGTAEEDGAPKEEVIEIQDTSFVIKLEVPSSDKPIDMLVSPMELVQELHHRLMDMEGTCHKTCFQLQFNGNTLDLFMELKNIEGLEDGSVIKVVDEPYTQRKARMHVRHIRDLMNSLSQNESYNGVDLCSPSFVNIITDGDLGTANNLDASKQVSSEQATDCTPPSYMLPLAKEAPIQSLLIKTAEQKKNLQALKKLTLSGWNPPPGPRKLRGDLLYMYVVTLEDKTYHITSNVRGFYVNNSTEDSFDPRPNAQLGKGSQTYHSLVDLLNHLSNNFKKNFAQIQKQRCLRNELERVPTSYQVYPWICPNLEHTLDAIRAEDASSSKLGYEEQIPGQIRDWNDELQSTKELPHQNLGQRLVRERAVFKVNSDFINAATRGAVAVVDGNVLALNPGEEFKSQMFIWNNIFFSFGFDVRDHYKDVGGDAAAFVAPINDLKGVHAYFHADVDGLYTLGTVVVDYKGYRVMAQSIIPGILEKEQDQSVVYGSVDSKSAVVTHEKYLELLNKAAESLKISPHNVLNAEKEEVALSSSVECKGIIGDDGRHYILDLMRSFPPDINYLQQKHVSLNDAVKALGFPKYHKHKLASLRQELVEHFVESKYIEFMRHAAVEYRKMEEKEKPKEESDEKKSEEEEKKESEEENEKMKEKKMDILRSASKAVNSIKDEEFCIKFNADAFLEHIALPESEILNRERALIREAAEFLVLTQVPGLVRECSEHSTNIIDGVTLTAAFHNKGINMRYLGYFASLVAKNENLSYIYRIAVTDMICRSAKHFFHEYMQSVEGFVTAQAVSHFLNCLFSQKCHSNYVSSNGSSNNKSRNKKRNKSSQSTTAVNGTSNGHVLEWTTLTPASLFDMVKKECKKYFDHDLKGDSFENCYVHYGIVRSALLRSFCSRVGIQLMHKNYYLNAGSSGAIFSDEDIYNLYPIVKHIEPRATDALRFYMSGQNKIQQGFLKDGFELVAEALSIMNQVYGPMHAEIVQCLRLLARLSYVMGDYDNALIQQQRAVIMSERVNGLDSPQTIQEYASLALYSFAAGQVSVCLKLYYRMRALFLVICGEKHPDIAVLDANIGLVLYALKQHELALTFLESSLRLFQMFYGDKSMKTALAYHLVARTQSCLGDFRSALKSEKETFQIYKGLLGEEHDKTKESSECLKHLTTQAVVLQKQINDLSETTNMPKNANNVMPPIHVNAPPLSDVLDLLNIINGIIFVQISPQEIEELKAQLKRKAAEAQEQADGDKKEIEDVPQATQTAVEEPVD